MRTWIAGCSPLALVRIRHHVLVQQQANSPLPNRKKFELLTPWYRARLEGAIAVEPTIYRGIESRYGLSRAEDRDAVLGGLMHGLRFDDLRITDETIERCVGLQGTAAVRAIMRATPVSFRGHNKRLSSASAIGLIGVAPSRRFPDRGALNRYTPYERLSRPRGPRGVSDEAFEEEATPSRGGGCEAQAGRRRTY